jgi:hypothetical protein
VVEVKKASAEVVLLVDLSKVSLMVPGLIIGMNEQELKNLIAYLITNGSPQHAGFSKE